MEMKEISPLGALIIIAVGLVAMAVALLVYMNRSSEKILTAVIPIAVTAIAGVVLAIFVFVSEPAIEDVFPASFMYEVDSRMPAQLSETRQSVTAQFAPARLLERYPERVKDKDDELGALLYHHLLQKDLIGWIGLLYRGSWQAEILTFDGPTGRQIRFQPSASPAESSRVITNAELVTLMRGNKFADIEVAIPPQIAIPPHATLTISPPLQRSDGLVTSEILIADIFCKLSIRTEQSNWIRSIGAYESLLGVPHAYADRLATTTYIVRFKAEFRQWLSGNPEMPKYRRWATQLAKEIKAQFDEESIWRAIREQHRVVNDFRIPEPPRRRSWAPSEIARRIARLWSRSSQ
jgi:hypothetical protein